MSRSARQGISRLLGYQAPDPLVNNKAILAESDIGRLCSAFRELDFLFLAAVKQGCELKRTPGLNIGSGYDDWKDEISVDEKMLTTFNLLNGPMNDLQYIQDTEKLNFWASAMVFMELESEGFPGRSILERGSFKKNTKPPLLRSGWSSHIDVVADVAMRLPRQVLRAANNGSLQDPRIFRGVHARIVKLDGFLYRTWHSYSGTDPPELLAKQIDDSWPWTISQAEPFSSTIHVATAYPRYQRNTISIMTMTAIVSVISTALALISIQRSPDRGYWSDGDFYSLCQGSLISISGIIVLIFTVFFGSPRIAKEAWRSAWLLALLSLATAIVAVPLYGLVSPKWSTALAAVSGTLQLWISVMLMFIVS